MKKPQPLKKWQKMCSWPHLKVMREKMIISYRQPKYLNILTLAWRKCQYGQAMKIGGQYAKAAYPALGGVIAGGEAREDEEEA